MGESDAILAAARQADVALRPHVRETPLIEAAYIGTRVRLKLETIQVTGSFKFRGALNRLMAIPADDRSRGVVTASTGNHGAAVAHAGALLTVPVRVFVPDDASPAKLERIAAAGAEITTVEGDPLNAERMARALAAERGVTYVSPYNDPAVVAGQATVGLELARQLADPPGAVFVPLGGGGLAAGTAIAVKSRWPAVRLIACSPERSAVMARSIEGGRVLELRSEPTLSDGTAGGIETDSITFDLCRQWVDDYVTVSEEEIADALRDLIGREHVLVEGAAAVALAGYRRLEGTIRGGAVVVLSGANIAPSTLVRVLSSPNGAAPVPPQGME